MAAVLNMRGYEWEAAISLCFFVNKLAQENGLTKSLTLTLDCFGLSFYADFENIHFNEV